MQESIFELLIPSYGSTVTKELKEVRYQKTVSFSYLEIEEKTMLLKVENYIRELPAN